jgi:hypothetical protein
MFELMNTNINEKCPLSFLEAFIMMNGKYTI